MGNKQSTGEGEFEAFSQNYGFIKKFNDSRFGDVKLLQEKSTGAKIFQKDYVSNTSKDFELIQAEVKRRAAVNHPNIIRIIGYTTKKEDAFCADYYKISVYYECYDRDLEHENYIRTQRKESYPETELWYILDCIITAGAHLEANNEAHGDIRPYNILVSSNNEYKIVDNKLFTGGALPSFYNLMNDLENKGRYFSPELFKRLHGGEGKTDDYNKPKSDIFSLGLTILECAKLQNLEHLYNWDNFSIDHERIEAILAEITEKKAYSATLIGTLRYMLNPDAEHRPNFLKIDSELCTYRADIKARVLKNEIGTSETPIIQVRETDEEENNRTDTKYDEEELDRRIKAAIEKSEETIKNSPAKHITENLNAYYSNVLSNYATAGNGPTTSNGATVGGDATTGAATYSTPSKKQEGEVKPYSSYQPAGQRSEETKPVTDYKAGTAAYKPSTTATTSVTGTTAAGSIGTAATTGTVATTTIGGAAGASANKEYKPYTSTTSYKPATAGSTSSAKPAEYKSYSAYSPAAGGSTTATTSNNAGAAAKPTTTGTTSTYQPATITSKSYTVTKPATTGTTSTYQPTTTGTTSAYQPATVSGNSVVTKTTTTGAASTYQPTTTGTTSTYQTGAKTTYTPGTYTAGAKYTPGSYNATAKAEAK